MNNRPTRMPQLISAFAATLVAVHAADISPSEFKARRSELISRFPDGIVLLHARADFYGWGAFNLAKGPSFYYFFGGVQYINSTLALDGRWRETWLCNSRIVRYQREADPSIALATSKHWRVQCQLAV